MKFYLVRDIECETPQRHSIMHLPFLHKFRFPRNEFASNGHTIYYFVSYPAFISSTPNMDLESRTPQGEPKSDPVERFWNAVQNISQRHQFKLLLSLRIIVAICYNCFFAAAVYHARVQQLYIDWCDGVGMLIILTVLVYCGLFYYKIFKPLWGDCAYQRVILPLIILLQRCWSYR